MKYRALLVTMLLVVFKIVSLLSRMYVNVVVLSISSDAIVDIFSIEEYKEWTMNLERALYLNDCDERAYHWLGIMHYRMSSYADAVVNWHRGKLSGEYFTDRGDSAFKAGMMKEAQEWYSMALILDPLESDAWYHLGEMYYARSEWNLAIDAWYRAVKSDRFRKVGISDAHLGLGMAYEKVGDIYEAAEMYKVALSLNSFSSSRLKAEAYYKKGESLRHLGYDPKEYMVDYQHALSLAPYHRWAALRLGIAVYQVSGDLSLSVQYIKVAIANWPLDRARKWPFLYAGQVYYDSGRVRESIYSFSMALRVDPDDEEGRKWLEVLRDDHFCGTK